MSWQSNVRKTHRRYCGHATCSDRKWCDCPSATVLASGPLHRWKILVRRTKVSQTTFKENTSVCENFIFSVPEGAWFWGELSNRLSPSSLHPANHTCSWFLGEATNKEKPHWYLSVQNIFSKWLKNSVLVSTSRKTVRCLMIYCLPSERLRERQEVEVFGCSFPNPNQDALEAPHTSLQASA